jgi:hypothetical protein
VFGALATMSYENVRLSFTVSVRPSVRLNTSYARTFNGVLSVRFVDGHIKVVDKNGQQ